MKENVLERFLRYVKIDTQSNEESETTPSTEKQFNLAKMLVDELHSLGVKNAYVDEHCYVYARLESNLPDSHPAKGKVPSVGFLAHLDTSPDVSGENVKPQIINNYQGGDIVLPNDNAVVIKVDECPALKTCVGHTLVTTDGTTLLGADNKAGVASIMTAVQEFVTNPELLHGALSIGFTPDEEIGKGTVCFDLEKFNAKYAYTIDGEVPGELNKETFSANSAIIRIFGRDIHPGMAKDIMVNSIRVAADIITRLPQNMAPETTEKYEPYIHPHHFDGSVGQSTIKFLLRDFKTEGLDEQKIILEKIIKDVQKIHPKARIELEIIEMYRNMREKLDENPMVLECLWEAAERVGTNPYWEPIRGGTDGSRLTAMGLPTPNIYTGSKNFHSKTEWLSVEFLNKTVETIINVAKVYVEKNS